MSFINQKLDQYIIRKSSEWEDPRPAWLGDHNGVIQTSTPGIINARVSNGQVIKVVNNHAPATFDLQVVVARSKTNPLIWQIVGERSAFLAPATTDRVKNHHDQHGFMQVDMLGVDRGQILQFSVWVLDAENFDVVVLGGTFNTPDGQGIMETDDGKRKKIALLSYIPAAGEGAVYINIEMDYAGVLSVHEGTNYPAVDLVTIDDVPTPDPNKILIASVLLFEGMELLKQDYIRVPMPLPLVPQTNDYQIHTASEVTELQDADEVGIWNSLTGMLAKITWANIKATLKNYLDTFYATIEHVHTPFHIHSIERWNGASGQAIFDLTDIAVSIESVFIDGAEVDPFNYLLSDDETQIILSSALGADALVIAHTFLENL